MHRASCRCLDTNACAFASMQKYMRMEESWLGSSQTPLPVPPRAPSLQTSHPDTGVVILAGRQDTPSPRGPPPLLRMLFYCLPHRGQILQQAPCSLATSPFKKRQPIMVDTRPPAAFCSPPDRGAALWRVLPFGGAHCARCLRPSHGQSGQRHKRPGSLTAPTSLNAGGLPPASRTLHTAFLG